MCIEKLEIIEILLEVKKYRLVIGKGIIFNFVKILYFYFYVLIKNFNNLYGLKY